MKRLLNTRPLFNMLCTSGAWTIFRKGDTLPPTKVSLLWWSRHTSEGIHQGMLMCNHPNQPNIAVDLADSSHRYSVKELNALLRTQKFHVSIFKPTLRRFSERQALAMFNAAYKEMKG